MHFVGMFTRPTSAEQCLHNALCVVSAMKSAGITTTFRYHSSIDYDVQVSLRRWLWHPGITPALTTTSRYRRWLRHSGITPALTNTSRYHSGIIQVSLQHWLWHSGITPALTMTFRYHSGIDYDIQLSLAKSTHHLLRSRRHKFSSMIWACMSLCCPSSR